MLKEFCDQCNEYRGPMVGFDGEQWCIRCDHPLNAAAWQRIVCAPYNTYMTIVFGQRHRVMIASNQSGVDSNRLRVLDVTDHRPMIVPCAHLHLAA